MARQVGRDPRKIPSDGVRRNGRHGSGRNRVALEHSRSRHTLRSFPQVVRHHQQGSAALVHRSRET